QCTPGRCRNDWRGFLSAVVNGAPCFLWPARSRLCKVPRLPPLPRSCFRRGGPMSIRITLVCAAAPRIVAAIGIAAVVVIARPAAVHANPRAEAVLAKLPFSDAERKKILAGELVTMASREQTSDRELVITMAFLITKPPPDLADMFQKAVGYDSDKGMTARGELRGDGSLADLQTLSLRPKGDAEARRFADAKGGDDL